MSLLPYDILFFILIGLPAKSLLRFQSVSKLWDSAISDKKFKKAHCDQSKALGRLKFLLRKRVSTYTPSSAGNTSLWIRPILRKNTTFKESNTHRLPFFQCSNNISYVKVYEEIEFVELKNPQVVTEKQQFPLTGSQISVLCSHDGLLLLCTYKACDEFVLWNPSTRQDKKFVCPYVITPTCIVPNACGLCYDSITGDYKFILIFRSFYVVCSANNNLWMMRNTLPVLEENLAETINSSWSNLSYYGITEGISTSEGCVYWSLDCPLYTSRRKLLVQQVSKNSRIIRFDAKSYKLKELPAPDFVGEGELFCLSTLKGCLILNGGKVKDQESNIWIKEEDGWKWLLKVRRLPAYIEQTKLLYCTEDGEYIFLGPMKDHVSISDPKRDTYDVQSYKPDQSEYVNALADPVCLDSLCFPTLN